MEDRDIIIFAPNSEDVIYELENCALVYPPNRREFDYVFAKVEVFPVLYKKVATEGRIPPVRYLCRYLVDNYTDYQDYKKPPVHREAITNRTQKLVMDFYRDLHTMSILCSRFSSIVYERGHDISYNVDFRATIKFLGQVKEVGIAAAMHHPRNWGPNGINFLEIKRQRKIRRNCEKWAGDMLWLTNQNRPYAVEINGVWLFGPDHISDLVKFLKTVPAKTSSAHTQRVNQ